MHAEAPRHTEEVSHLVTKPLGDEEILGLVRHQDVRCIPALAGKHRLTEIGNYKCLK